MLRTLDKYIIKKFLGTYIYAILLIIAISVVFDFSEKIDDFLEKKAPFSAIVFDYYLNFIPYFVNLFSYLFTFIAVIFFTSKMAGRSEIIAILSSGVSFRRLMRPYLVSATIIALLTYLLNGWIIPPANKVRLAFEEKYIKNRFQNANRNIHQQISPGVYIYMQSFNAFENEGYQFSMEKFKDGQLVSKLMSNHIRWDSVKSKWTIHDYYIRNYVLDTAKSPEKISEADLFAKTTENFKKGTKTDTALAVTPADFKRRLNVVEAMNDRELGIFIKQEQERGAESIEPYLIEKYRRWASPFATFVLTIIGISVACRKVRGGIGLHIGVGLGLSFAYILFLQISSQFGISGTLSPQMAVWLPNIIFVGIAILMYRMAPK